MEFRDSTDVLDYGRTLRVSSLLDPQRDRVAFGPGSVGKGECDPFTFPADGVHIVIATRGLMRVRDCVSLVVLTPSVL